MKILKLFSQVIHFSWGQVKLIFSTCSTTKTCIYLNDLAGMWVFWRNDKKFLNCFLTKQHLLNSFFIICTYLGWKNNKIYKVRENKKLWMYLSQWADLDAEDTGIHPEKIPVRKKKIFYTFFAPISAPPLLRAQQIYVLHSSEIR